MLRTDGKTDELLQQYRCYTAEIC